MAAERWADAVVGPLGALLEPECRTLRSEAFGQLAELVAARRRLLRDRTVTITRAKTFSLDLLKRRAALRLQHIARQIGAIDAQARALVAADPPLARRFAILTSIPRVGAAAAVALMRSGRRWSDGADASAAAPGHPHCCRLRLPCPARGRARRRRARSEAEAAPV